MKLRFSLLLLLTVIFTACGMQSRPVLSPFWETGADTAADKDYEEILLTSLDYSDYALFGDSIPYYYSLGTENEPLSVGGTVFKNGICISPISPREPGYIEYKITEASERFDTFVCKIGKIDGGRGNGAPVSVHFIVDGKLMSRTPFLSRDDEAYLIDVVIPYGAKTLRIECKTENGAGGCTTVIGDGRFLHAQHLDKIPWP